MLITKTELSHFYAIARDGVDKTAGVTPGSIARLDPLVDERGIMVEPTAFVQELVSVHPLWNAPKMIATSISECSVAQPFAYDPNK